MKSIKEKIMLRMKQTWFFEKIINIKNLLAILAKINCRDLNKKFKDQIREIRTDTKESM